MHKPVSLKFSIIFYGSLFTILVLGIMFGPMLRGMVTFLPYVKVHDVWVEENPQYAGLERVIVAPLSSENPITTDPFAARAYLDSIGGEDLTLVITNGDLNCAMGEASSTHNLSEEDTMLVESLGPPISGGCYRSDHLGKIFISENVDLPSPSSEAFIMHEYAHSIQFEKDNAFERYFTNIKELFFPEERVQRITELECEADEMAIAMGTDPGALTYTMSGMCDSH